MRDLGREGDLVLQDVHTIRDDPAFRVALPIKCDALRGIALSEQCRKLPVLRDDPVGGWVERHGRPHDRSLLAMDRGEGAELTLPLQAKALGVERAPELHVAQGVEYRGKIVLGRVVAYELAFLVDEP